MTSEIWVRGAAGRGRGALVGVLAALALAGCGTPASELSHALGVAARASQAASSLSRRLLDGWCPHALAGDGRDLTETQARACLRRAWQGWLRELRRDGYNPSRVGR